MKTDYMIGQRVKCKQRPDVQAVYFNQTGKITEIIEQVGAKIFYRVLFDTGFEGVFQADKYQLKVIN